MGGATGGPGKTPGVYLGWWGNFGGLPQKGVTTYALSANRQKLFAGATNAAVFNTWRRFKGAVLYVAPPFVLYYFLMDWANKYNHFLNSKEGRALHANDEE
ncbi:cytochrome b-c1 complex subunit 8 [Sphaerosporella brunnea]|uniref:Cytochrome b-c1 complex subunit 8 n=1 Tax=Sphaerosporella brunnea TaxID=1250544 RepID=A0A5J5F2X0_9PEZI|nr:cytochrome b-c1 complex subunit 8 [Sphaerosporella brunnea]